MTILEQNKERVAWYVLGGVEGVIAWSDSEKFKNLKSLDECCDKAFYALADIDFVLEPGDGVCCEYAESYDMITDKGSEIVNERVKNIENEQCLIDEFVSREYYENDLYERELLDYTNQYYDWKSERTNFIDACSHYDWSREECEKDWKEICSHYAGMNHYCEEAKFDDLWESIEYNRQVRE